MININDIVIAWLNQQPLKDRSPKDAANLYDHAYKQVSWIVKHDYPSKPGKANLFK